MMTTTNMIINNAINTLVNNSYTDITVTKKMIAEAAIMGIQYHIINNDDKSLYIYENGNEIFSISLPNLDLNDLNKLFESKKAFVEEFIHENNGFIGFAWNNNDNEYTLIIK